MSASATTAVATDRAAPGMRSVVLASAIGTTIEWNDVPLYGTAAALVFVKLSFPNLDPLAGTLAAIGSHAVGFVARPLGGAIFGHFDDRIGRTAMLMLTMVVTGSRTFLIGCLPTCPQSGIWAPILLVVLRPLQSIGIGGEWGAAVSMVLEPSERDRSGLIGNLVQIGFRAGMVLAFIGLLVRLRRVETPFPELQARRATLKQPVLHVLAHESKAFRIAVGMKVSEVAWVYILTVFVVMYAATQLTMPRSTILDAALYAATLELLTVPFFGRLSGKWGRRTVYLGGALLSALLAYPLFALVETRDPTIITLTLLIAMSIGHATMYGPQASFMPERFGTGTRCSGASLGCQVSAALSGDFAPVIATGLLAWQGNTHAVSVFMIALALITLLAVGVAKETAGRPMRS